VTSAVSRRLAEHRPSARRGDAGDWKHRAEGGPGVYARPSRGKGMIIPNGFVLRVSRHATVVLDRERQQAKKPPCQYP
jgi:hypothetical protein